MADDDDAGPSEEVFEETESRESFLAAVDARRIRVEKLLSSQKVADALMAALEDPPTDTRDETVKMENWHVVHKAIMAVRDADVVIRVLPSDYRDTLMKYLYRGLETGDRYTCEQCLRLHEKLTAIAGMGCIMRALVDRRHKV